MKREDRIRIRAYDIWVAEGCPEGRERDHWEQAVAEIEASIMDDPENTGTTPPVEAATPTAVEVAPQPKPSLARRAA